ncbi:hypothetical protein C475_06280 [Halosimplex carlsbadense 2-9-1]|uniref:PemK family protein n=1 Tax=Halosimplex carlsbadense 2-9-1 TaxID=797114 RepID=M0D056_9EURY|nr:hypothetical protein [Halosimplex carlsbadense]ELZ27504.1 hypothetical protein C475_06280 [Halosimplex carlsbadense 2-9-1]
MSDRFAAGDVFWAPDPYNTGGDPRPWLVLAAESIPYAGEEYVCAGLTLSDLPDNVEVTAEDWVVGADPERTSYCSPWVLATVKHGAVASAQGSVTDAFTRRVVDRSVAYLSGDVSVES